MRLIQHIDCRGDGGAIELVCCYQCRDEHGFRYPQDRSGRACRSPPFPRIESGLRANGGPLMPRPRVALIAGPTASGKSALALALAERHRGTVINADSAQVYRDLRVLSARPTIEEEARAPHCLFGYIDGAESCSAARWAADATA